MFTLRKYSTYLSPYLSSTLSIYLLSTYLLSIYHQYFYNNHISMYHLYHRYTYIFLRLNSIVVNLSEIFLVLCEKYLILIVCIKNCFLCISLCFCCGVYEYSRSFSKQDKCVMLSLWFDIKDPENQQNISLYFWLDVIALTILAGIIDHREVRQKHTEGKILEFISRVHRGDID